MTFIAVELICGEPFRDVLRRERLSRPRSLELAAIEVAEGLAHAEGKGMVHRDLKPANVMVTEDGHAKIIDLGLAKLVEPLSGGGSNVETALRGETDPGAVVGTVSYMSREQARGRKVDQRSDIFSFGVGLYEMLTGQLPFQWPSPPEILNAVINAPTPPLELGYVEGNAPELKRIVSKCLAKDASSTLFRAYGGTGFHAVRSNHEPD